jgi:outer membrane biosynthesis protein TonB
MTEGLDLSPVAAAQSEDWVLELKPRTYAEATEGPHPQISATTYVTWTRPGGDSFVAPLANVETYERKGFTRGADVDMSGGLQAYLDEQAQKEPAMTEEPRPPQPGPQPPEPEPMPPPQPEPEPEPAPPTEEKASG